MISGLFIFTPESGVVFNFGVVVNWFKVAFVVHTEESLGVILDVVDEEDAV